MMQVQPVQNAGQMPGRKKTRFIQVRSANSEVRQGRASVVIARNVLHIQMIM